MEMVYRLRATLWRAAAYPLMVLAGLLAVVVFLSLGVLPQFRTLFREFNITPPLLTRLLLGVTAWMPSALVVLACLVGLAIVLWVAARLTGADRAVVDAVVLPMPLVGPVLRRNLVARWCDAVRLGVVAGLDLPRAVELAGDAVASPRLRRDSDEIIGILNSGQSLDVLVGATRVLPATVPAAMALASERGDLAGTLATLSEMYQQQADHRLNMIPGLLTPVLILLVAGIIGLVVLALFLPFMQMFRLLS
jgi:type IV pilus assembly protein PilC